jgi:CubicO group peptidase (beta-lactamase class C family)
MKILRKLLASLLIIVGALLLYLAVSPPSLLKVGAAYSAKIVCSNVFLAHRDAQEVLSTDVQAPGVALLKLVRVKVDTARGLVRASFLGFIAKGIAVYRPGKGCTAVPDGNLDFAHAADAAIGSAAPAAAGKTDPTSLWPEGERAQVVDDYQKILDNDSLTGPGMRAALIVSKGHLVAERYAPGFDAGTPLLGWSMAKTVTAGLIGLLVKDGKLTIDQAGFWKGNDGREHIRIADLLAMSSGLKFNEDYGVVSDVTQMLYLEPDMAGFAHDQPLAHPIGTVWSYSSGTANIVARIAQDAGGPLFTQDRLFGPLGMTSAVIEPDEHGTQVGSSYMYATAHDWARFGLWLAQNGQWHGEALLPSDYVDMMASPVKPSLGEYGHGFVWLWGSDPCETRRKSRCGLRHSARHLLYVRSRWADRGHHQIP